MLTLSVTYGHNHRKLLISVYLGHNALKITLSVKIACAALGSLPFGESEQQKIIILLFKATFQQPPMLGYQVRPES